MAGRTFAVGDIHGEADQLEVLLQRLPALNPSDTLVFLGDYVDRGLDSAAVVERVRGLPSRVQAQVVALRGNHEDAWLQVVEQGWDEFVRPPDNGCLATLRSYTNGHFPSEGELPRGDERFLLETGAFFPDDVVDWFRQRPLWFENEDAIFVHAGLISSPTGFLHPSQTSPASALLWCREERFFRAYLGKLVVFGHTRTALLPQDVQTPWPGAPVEAWRGPSAVALDTGCGQGGFLSAVELPSLRTYDSR